MIYGLKVVDTTRTPRPSIHSTNPDDFIFNSVWNSVKTFKAQMSSLALASQAIGTIEIAHGLSFIPASMIYTEDATNPGRFYFGNYVQMNGSTVVMDSYCNATHLKIKLVNPTSSTKVYRVYSFIFADNGQ